jgi:hypothetical protein
MANPSVRPQRMRNSHPMHMVLLLKATRRMDTHITHRQDSLNSLQRLPSRSIPDLPPKEVVVPLDQMVRIKDHLRLRKIGLVSNDLLLMKTRTTRILILGHSLLTRTLGLVIVRMTRVRIQVVALASMTLLF